MSVLLEIAFENRRFELSIGHLCRLKALISLESIDSNEKTPLAGDVAECAVQAVPAGTTN